MNRKGILFGFLFMAASGIMLSSCIKENNGETIALIGTEYYIDDILSVIPDSLQDKFETFFEGFPEGAIPDSLGDSCAFVVSPNMLLGTNHWDLSSPIVHPDVYMRFSKQHNGIMAMELYEESTLKKTDTVFVMGSGNAFTVYFIEDKDLDLDIHAKRGVIMCGRLTENGVADFRMVSVVLESEGEQAPVPGTYFYYEDGNGLAEKCDWPWP